MSESSFGKVPSNVLQALQYSLRQGFQAQKDKRISYERDRFLKRPENLVRFDNNLKLLEKIFKEVNMELVTRRKKEKLRKCYGDVCHSKCSDNCTCGWCLLRKGYEPLI